MSQTSHQVQPAALRFPGRRSKRRVAGIVLVASVLLAGGAVFVERAAIQGRPVAAARTDRNVVALVSEQRLGASGSAPAQSLQNILAHPDLIPSHNHPLLNRKAPDFELADADGKAWKLNEMLADGPVVLVFYHDCDCALCVRQLFDGNKDLPLFRELGARMVAISATPSERTRRRLEQFSRLGLLILSDPGNKAAQAYQVFRQAPDGTTADVLLHGTFIIDRRGVIRWANVGDMPFRRNAALLSQLAKIEGRSEFVR